MTRALTCVFFVLAIAGFVYAKAPDFTGSYADDSVVVEFHATDQGYEGVLHDADEHIPLQGRVQGRRIIGTFTYQGETIPFNAELNGRKLSLSAEGTTIILTRQNAPKARAAGSPQTAVRSGDRTPQTVTPIDVKRFRRISVQDRQVIGGEAVSFLIPVEWRIEGGIVWRLHPALPAGARIRVFNPSSPQQVEAFPSFPYTWGDSCGPGKLMPTGARWFGNEVHPPFRSTQECLETSIIPRIRSPFRWRVTGRERLPELAVAHQQNSPREPGGRVFFDAARVRIQYEINGVSVEEDIFAVMQTVLVPAGNIIIQIADRVIAMRAERGRLDAARPLHLTIVNSSKINLQWYNKYAQIVDFLVRAKMQEIRAIGEFSRALSRASSRISEQRMQQWSETNRRQDRIDREWSEYIRGTETYNDPVGGEPVELPSGHNHAWVSRSGEYILTDNPNFNPNVERRGDWVEMKPTP
jgi:hypothetical protein